MKKKIIISMIYCLIIIVNIFHVPSVVLAEEVASGGAVSIAGSSAAVSGNTEGQKTMTKNPGKKYKDIYEYVDDVYADKSASYRKKIKQIIKGSKWYGDVGASVSYENRDKYLKKIVENYNNGKSMDIDKFVTAVRKYDGSSTNPVTAISDGVFGVVDYVDTVGKYAKSGDWLPFVDEPEEGTAAWEYYNKKVGNEVRTQFKTTNEMVDYIYGGSSKKTQKLIKTYLDKNPSLVAGIKNNGYYEPTTEFLGKLSTIEQRGTITSSVSSKVKGINNSESLAVGDMYAQDDNTDSYSTYVDEGPDTLEGEVAKLLTSLANGLNNLVGMCDGTLDKLVYGRLVYYGTNFFSFELVKANPYGIVGGYVYKLFRNLVIPLLILLLFSKFAKAAWSSGSGEQRRLFKDTLGRTVLMLLLVFLVPNIVDALIAIRDIVLNYLSSNLSTDMSTFFGLADGNDKTLIGYYKSNATNNGYLLDALLYLGVSFISIFYMITYISTAVAVMVSFMFFPLIVIFSFTENKMIDMWFKELLGNVFVPVLDAVLLLMPLMLNQFLPNNDTKSYLISFIACYSVIPSRAVIRGMLGVGGNIRSELLGFGALMGTMRMLSGIKNRVTGGVKGLWGAHKQNKADREMADMYADLARANGEGDQLTGRFASLGRLSSTEDKKENEPSLSNITDNKEPDSNGGKNSDADTEKGLSNENPQSLDQLGSTVSDDEQGTDSIENANSNTEVKPLDNATDENNDEDNNAETSSLAGESTDGTSEGQAHSEEESGLQEDNIAASVGNEGSDEVEKVEARTPEEQREIDKKNVLKGYVNTDNFENKEFKNCLNFAERAKMHRQRANRNAIKSTLGAVGGVAGGIGMGALGAAAFGGATMFAGSKTNIAAMTAGANIGSHVGSNVGRSALGAVGSVASGVHEVAKTGSAHPIRQTAARIGDMVVREAGVAPGVANNLYQKTESYKTKPNDSTFAHRLAFDPSQTTVPQRKPSTTYERKDTNTGVGRNNYQDYQNSSSSIELNNEAYTPVQTPQVDTSALNVGLPDLVPPFEETGGAKFDTLENTYRSLGYKDEEMFDTAVENCMDAFSNPENPDYEFVNSQLQNMMNTKQEKKKTELLEKGIKGEVLNKRMAKAGRRMQEESMATIVKNIMYDKTINAVGNYINTVTELQKQRSYGKFSSLIQSDKENGQYVYKYVIDKIRSSKVSSDENKDEDKS